MNLALSTFEQGLIYAVLAMGLYLSYKVLDIADLSVEGTFPFGALLFAKLSFMGVSPILSMVVIFFGGSLAGLFTALLFIKLKIKPLLAGILTMTVMYSVNLRLNDKANVSLTGRPRVYDMLTTGNAYVDRIIVLLIIVVIIKIALDWYMQTEQGYLLQATGDNETFVTSLGQNANLMKAIGLMLSNGLIALSGSLMAQTMKFSDITFGTGIIVIALASIIIGDTFLKSQDRIKGTTRAIIGAIIYKIIGTVALRLGLRPQDLKMVNGAIVILFIAYNNFTAKRAQPKKTAQGVEK